MRVIITDERIVAASTREGSVRVLECISARALSFSDPNIGRAQSTIAGSSRLAALLPVPPVLTVSVDVAFGEVLAESDTKSNAIKSSRMSC